jgi:hypothetical protein
MNDLLDFVLDTHGGLKRWSSVSTLTAKLVHGQTHGHAVHSGLSLRCSTKLPRGSRSLRTRGRAALLMDRSRSV